MPKDAYYFPHDANARHDPNILAMRSVYGSEGLGWYWMIIEICREQEDYKIHLNEYTYNALAMQLQCDGIKLKKFIEDCATKFKNEKSCLLCLDDKFIWSNSLVRRMSVFEAKREKARLSANTRWSKEKNTNALPAQSESNASKVKQSKVKDIRNDILIGEGGGDNSVSINIKDSIAAENSNKKEPARVYEENIGMLTPVIADEIRDALKTYPKEWIVEAIIEAKKHNACSWSYIEKILERWITRGKSDIKQPPKSKYVDVTGKREW